MNSKDLLGKKSPTMVELADKYNTSVLTIMEQVMIGMVIEVEHTLDQRIAMEIALDHLGQDLHYYTKLKKMEAKD